MSQSPNHIAVIDYGMGNLHSVSKALEHICDNAKVSITSDPAVVAGADRVVFPGVGAIGDCMREIQRLKIGEVLRQAITDKPVLGICVGMQALLQHSEESGGVDCLGILPGAVKLFDPHSKDAAGGRLKVPHMGWNDLILEAPHPVFDGIKTGDHAYFVHSYHMQVLQAEQRLAHVGYDGEITAIIGRDNLLGMQFHPEKSQKTGLKLIANFLKWAP